MQYETHPHLHPENRTGGFHHEVEQFAIPDKGQTQVLALLLARNKMD
jgi:hypothetical protein